MATTRILGRNRARLATADIIAALVFALGLVAVITGFIVWSVA